MALRKPSGLPKGKAYLRHDWSTRQAMIASQKGECLWYECRNRSGRLEQRSSPEVGDLVLEQVFEPLFDHSIEIFLFHSNGANAIGSNIKCHLSQGRG